MRWKDHKKKKNLLQPEMYLCPFFFSIYGTCWKVGVLFYFYCPGVRRMTSLRLEAARLQSFRHLRWNLSAVQSEGYKNFGKCSAAFTRCLRWRKKKVKEEKETTLNLFRLSPPFFRPFSYKHTPRFVPSQSTLCVRRSGGRLFTIAALPLTTRFTAPS